MTSVLTYVGDALPRLKQNAGVKIDQLKLRLGQILAEEEGDGSVDWSIVQLRSDELLGELQVPIPLIVHEYLRGSDRRQQDSVYAHAQRSQLLHFLRGH